MNAESGLDAEVTGLTVPGLRQNSENNIVISAGSRWRYGEAG